MRGSSLLVVSLILASLLVLSGGAQAALEVISFTPTAFLYMPLVARQPTSTPTVTPTPTSTPTATPIPGGGSLTGQITREDPNKPTYATHIEDIWFYDLIHNGTGSPANFGILGVNVVGPNSYFKTLWDGAGALGGVLTLNAGCYGPNGIPCAADADAGRQRASLRVYAPGTYQLILSICYSSFSACQAPGGNWQDLSSVSITAVDWTPTPSANPLPPVTPAAAERCQLVTTDPRGRYLYCP